MFAAFQQRFDVVDALVAQGVDPTVRLMVLDAGEVEADGEINGGEVKSATLYRVSELAVAMGYPQGQEGTMKYLRETYTGMKRLNDRRYAQMLDMEKEGERMGKWEELVEAAGAGGAYSEGNRDEL